MGIVISVGILIAESKNEHKHPTSNEMALVKSVILINMEFRKGDWNIILSKNGMLKLLMLLLLVNLELWNGIISLEVQ